MPFLPDPAYESIQALPDRRRGRLWTPAGPTVITPAFLTDNFTDTNGAALTSHTSDSGHSWTNQSGWGGSMHIQGNRAVYDTANGVMVAASATPPTADYEVTVSFRIVTQVNVEVRACGRMSTADTTVYFANTYWEGASNGGQLYIGRYLPGFVFSNISGFVAVPNGTYTVGSDHTLTLRMIGNQISLIRDDAQTVGPFTDTGITQVGKAGTSGAGGLATASTGLHIDSITATAA